MKFFTLQDKYSEHFENDTKNVFYKQLKEVILEYNVTEYIDNTVLDIVNNFQGFINLVDIINNIIEISKRSYPFNNLKEFKETLVQYCNQNICKLPKDVNSEYTFYQENRIQMEILYRVLSKQKFCLEKHKNTAGVIPNIEVKLNKKLREVSEIIFDNETYKFGIFYDKKEFKGLNFWRLNESSQWERLNICAANYSSQDPYDLLDYDNPFIGLRLCQDNIPDEYYLIKTF